MMTNWLGSKFVCDEILDSLDQAVGLLESVVTPQFQEQICEMPADELCGLHLSLGMWIRNNILRTELGSKILLVGKTIPESASSHIILAFWQRLRARRWSRTSLDVSPALPPIVVLGLGGPGTNWVTNFHLGNQDASIASDTLFLTRLHSVQALNWRFNPHPEDRQALEDAFLRAKEVLIVGSVGGSLCRILVGSYMFLARSRGIAPTALVSMPGECEGGIRCRRALESVSDLELSGLSIVTVHESSFSNLESMDDEQWYTEMGKQVEQKIGDWLNTARQHVS